MDRYARPDARIKPGKIMVVDDEAVIRDMMVDILDMEGYAIEVARNGQEALEKLVHVGPEQSYLIFLDLLMPVMDGRAFCEHLNARPALRKRHAIVLMSALNHLSSTPSLHVDATLPKPFVVEDVLDIIQRLLQSQPI